MVLETVYLETITELKTYFDPKDLAYVAGYHTAGDGGGGMFKWDATSTQTPDEGIIFNSTAASGRWKRIMNESRSVKWFGAKGDGTTDDFWAFRAAIDSMSTVHGGELRVPVGVYRISDTLRINRGLVLQGESGFGWFAGSVLQFDLGKVGLHVCRDANMPPAPRGDWAVIQDLVIGSKLNGTDPNAHGILIEVPALVSRCLIVGFSGDGIRIFGDAVSAPLTGANLFRLSSLTIEKNKGNGIYVHGGDSNVGHGIGIDVRTNGKCGIWDNSFLGNFWAACHANNNVDSPYRSSNPNSRCVWTSCYVESDSLPADIRWPACWFGGMVGSGFTPESSGLIIDVGGNSPIGYKAKSLTGATTATVGLGSGNGTNSVFSFGGQEGTYKYDLKYYPQNTTGGFAQYGGWFSFNYGNNGNWHPLLLSTEKSTVGSGNFGAGQVWMPNGLVVGYSVNARHHTSFSSQPTWAAKVGNVVYNTNPTVGGYAGWIGVMVAGVPTWRPYGKID